ncbi:glycosyltransferase involved in cell wall biosynthesis [Actinophytocola oryzae]|uniref:Glycosyltransferase involved in cell wall biosynthesis n=2 Tax=Actinophytocola oryzae TaxID=502181 RepID=A0A4R7VG41_9PSEU|nr:glycosyltransferase involved in cell wall biosynthesis [Actinophytocola oryzae]
MIAGTDQLRGSVSRKAHVAALAEALTRAGHEVTVHTRHDDLTARLRSGAPDLVHAHCPVDGAAAAAHAIDVPFVFSPHEVTGQDDRALRSADHVVATFSAQRARLVAAGVARENISLVPYGVDLDLFDPDGDQAERTRPQRVVALGEMTPSSGFGTAVAALPALPEAELVIASEPYEGAHAHELRDYASSLGVADRVRLLGAVPHAEMPALLRSADLMVCTQWESTFGIAALEAMACGLAVVANKVGGLVDTVVDRVTGIHVTPRKPRELAATLQRVLSHRSTCEQFGAAGRDRATARYSWDRVAEETVYVYRKAGAADPEVLAQEAMVAERKRASRLAAQG